MGSVSLIEALDYLELLAALKPERLPAAAVRWHGRLELEASPMTLGESQLALGALTKLCEGDRESGRDSPDAPSACAADGPSGHVLKDD